MNLAYELEQRQQASRYSRKQHQHAKHYYEEHLKAVCILTIIGLGSLLYYEVYKHNEAMATPAHPGCVMSKSEAREVLHIAQVKPEKHR